MAPHEYQTENLPELTKDEKFLELSKQIIESNDNTTFLQKLFLQLFDKDFDLTKQLYEKLESSDLVDESIFNNFVWSAAHFEKKEELEAILETKKHDIDLQVYFKCILCHYEPAEFSTKNKDFADKVIVQQSKPSE